MTYSTHNSNEDKFNNLEKLTSDELGCNETLEASEKTADKLVDATRLLKRQGVIRSLNRSCRHRNINLLIILKRQVNIKPANLTSHFHNEFKVECLICMASAGPRMLTPSTPIPLNWGGAERWWEREW
jgi:hypothetical protein